MKKQWSFPIGLALLLVAALPLAATEVKPAPMSSPADEIPFELLLQPVQPAAACTVNIQCTPSIKISCSSPSGNCTTSGGGDCVVCDGITQKCCSTCIACRQGCQAEYLECREACPTRDCIYECAQARDACYASCC